jgi:hypothetical protein
MDSNNEIDAIVEQLRADSIPSTPHIQSREIVPQEQVTDDNVNEYILKKTTENIEAGLDAVNSLKDIVITGQNPQEIAALASLINATTKALDSLNKINLQNKQIKSDKELKQMEVTAVKSLKPATTNVLIATRDEVMSKLYDKTSKREKIELIEGTDPQL